jgi:hypothetical protein
MLSQALARKAAYLESTVLPRLKDYMSVFSTTYENIYSILLRKSLVREDPYKYDEKITEVTTPSSEEFLESDKQDQMSQRLSLFHTQLDFLSTTYQFSLDFLELRRIKRIVELIGYIKWPNLNSGPANIVSRTLAQMLSRIKFGSDAVSSQIVSNSLSQMARLSSDVLAQLNEIAVYQRELYKLQVREYLLPNLEPGAVRSPDAAKAIKQLFRQAMEGSQYYPELIQEILQEEGSLKGEALKRNVLSALAVKEVKKKKKRDEPSSKDILLQTVKVIASSGFQLQDVAKKIAENVVALASGKRKGVRGKFRRWLLRLLGQQREEKIYDIEYFDVVSATTKKERISIDPFVEELGKKARLYASLASSGGPATARLREASEEQIFNFVSRHISSLQSVHRKLTGLNTYFKEKSPHDRPGKLRGFQMELSAVKNCILKANQKRHEYVARKEESEQMKRLGLEHGETSG